VAQDGFIFKRIQNLFQDIDIYQNDIPLVDRAFVSPVSRYEYSFYHYVLNDILQTDYSKEYVIYFFPIHDGDLAFRGNSGSCHKTMPSPILRCVPILKSIFIWFVILISKNIF
jgi:hypothetical protein